MKHDKVDSNYLAPDIDVIYIKIEQNILQDASNDPMVLPPQDW